MAWVYLLLAGFFEAGWAIGLKQSDCFTRLWPSVATLILMSLSFALLANAMKHIPMGTAYAVWTGLGAVLVATIGTLVFEEPLSLLKIVSICLIVSGIVGLKLA